VLGKPRSAKSPETPPNSSLSVFIRFICVVKKILSLDIPLPFGHNTGARACGVWTYEPRQGRKAATAVCFAIAAVTLASLHLRFAIADLRFKIPIAVAIRA
jgi:hypothetical protein